MIGQVGWTKWQHTARYIDHRFDRQIFNPDRSDDDKATLMRLRQHGSCRAQYYHYAIREVSAWRSVRHVDDHLECCGSSALRCLKGFGFLEIQDRSECGPEVYLDLGAGDSPDVLIASALGYRAFSLDLFPPFQHGQVCAELVKRKSKFYVQADAISLPFANHSVDYITSQAMIDLVPKNERLAFYQEVFRVLKIGGVFSLTGANLRCGYGYSQFAEANRARTLGWEVKSANCGFSGTRTN